MGHLEVVAVVVVLVVQGFIGQLHLQRVVVGIDQLQPIEIDGKVLVAVSQFGLYLSLPILKNYLACQTHEVGVELFFIEVSKFV